MASATVTIKVSPNDLQYLVEALHVYAEYARSLDQRGHEFGSELSAGTVSQAYDYPFDAHRAAQRLINQLGLR